MGLNLFKKKDDDFSDFLSGSGNPGDPANTGGQSDGFYSGNQGHGGLPLDGNITDTSQQPPVADNSFQDQGSNPSAFNELSDLSQSRQKNPLPMEEVKQSQTPQNNSNSRLESIEKDIEIVDAKVDSIKSLLESLSHRLARLERVAEDSERREETVRW